MDVVRAMAASTEDEDAEFALQVALVSMAAVCTAIGWVVTVINIHQHFSHFNSPPHQKIIVQMLVLVIIWSTFSLLVVVRPQIQPVTMVAMDSYEAYLVLLFMHLMNVYLGGRKSALSLLERMPKVRVCAIPTRPNPIWYYTWTVFIYQFAIVKPGLAIVRCVLYYVDTAVDLPFDVIELFAVFRYTMIASLVVAMFGLLNFYRTFNQALKNYKVGAKFVAMKLFIFLHLMQSVLFTYLFKDESEDGQHHFYVARLEYFVVCVEMAIASFLNMYVVFTYREFLSDSNPSKPWIEYFRLDDARLAEWKTVLYNPLMHRQDSLMIESSTLPSRSISGSYTSPPSIQGYGTAF